MGSKSNGLLLKLVQNQKVYYWSYFKIKRLITEFSSKANGLLLKLVQKQKVNSWS